MRKIQFRTSNEGGITQLTSTQIFQHVITWFNIEKVGQKQERMMNNYPFFLHVVEPNPTPFPLSFFHFAIFDELSRGFQIQSAG